jgi:hypothetical protein
MSDSPSFPRQELTVPAWGPDEYCSDIFPVASDPQAPDGASTRQGMGTRCKAFVGPFGLSEEALGRLEAGLHAQREQFIARPARYATGPGFDSARDQKEHNKGGSQLAPLTAALRAQDVMPRLPRAAQLQPSLEITFPVNEALDSTPNNLNQASAGGGPEPLQFAPPREGGGNWRFTRRSLIATAAAAVTAYFLTDGTFPSLELFASVQLPSKQMKELVTAPASAEVDGERSNREFNSERSITSVPPSQAEAAQPPASASAGYSQAPLLSPQLSSPAAIAKSPESVLPSIADASSQRSLRGRDTSGQKSGHIRRSLAGRHGTAKMPSLNGGLY